MIGHYTIANRAGNFSSFLGVPLLIRILPLKQTPVGGLGIHPLQHCGWVIHWVIHSECIRLLVRSMRIRTYVIQRNRLGDRIRALFDVMTSFRRSRFVRMREKRLRMRKRVFFRAHARSCPNVFLSPIRLLDHSINRLNRLIEQLEKDKIGNARVRTLDLWVW